MMRSLKVWDKMRFGPGGGNRAQPHSLAPAAKARHSARIIRPGIMLKILADIWAFIRAIFERMDKTNMGLIAAGVAFYGMFAVFPGMAAIIALWSLWYDPQVIMTYVEVAEEFMPSGAIQIIEHQLNALLAGPRTSIGWTSLISFLIATVSARAGVNALIKGLNAAYGVRSHSTVFGFILAYILTLAIVGVVMLGLALIVILPILLNYVTLGPLGARLLAGLPWAGMFSIIIIGIGIMYRFGPNVKSSRPSIFTWGALIAALTWAGASIGFSAYLGSFNSYNRIYGSIGAVVALLMWFYLAGFSVLLGALVNVELSHRRRVVAARRLRANQP